MPLAGEAQRLNKVMNAKCSHSRYSINYLHYANPSDVPCESQPFEAALESETQQHSRESWEWQDSCPSL